MREKETEMEKLDDPTVRPVGSSNFFISIPFSLSKSLIQTQAKRNFRRNAMLGMLVKFVVNIQKQPISDSMTVNLHPKGGTTFSQSPC